MSEIVMRGICDSNTKKIILEPCTCIVTRVTLLRSLSTTKWLPYIWAHVLLHVLSELSHRFSLLKPLPVVIVFLWSPEMPVTSRPWESGCLGERREWLSAHKATTSENASSLKEGSSSSGKNFGRCTAREERFKKLLQVYFFQNWLNVKACLSF